MDTHTSLPLKQAIKREQVIAEAKTWLHTPWHHLGTVKGAGVDCAQLLREVYEACGLMPHFETGYYPPDWMLHREEERFLGFVEQYAHPVKTPMMGDIVVFKIGRCFAHGAIVVDWPSIIHAFRPEGQVCWGDAASGFLGDKQTKFYSVFE